MQIQAVPAEMPDPEQTVLRFIRRFSEDDKHNVRREIIDVFTNGCCFWFAYILVERFKDYEPEIVVDFVANHFGTRILGRVYDITGDVTEQYNWERWSDYEDPTHASRITVCCINF